MKELRDLKDLTIHEVQPISDEMVVCIPGVASNRGRDSALCSIPPT